MRLWQGCAVLAVVVFLAGGACGAAAAARGVAEPWLAATVAAGVCWLSGVVGLAVSSWAARRQPIYGPLAGMAFRLAPPLVVGLALRQQGGTLAQSQVFGMIVACYLAMLVAETWVSLATLSPVSRGAWARGK